jgi:hypothetical protein
MSHTFTKLLTHVIFSTKERRSLMDNELQLRLFPYLGGIVREIGRTPLMERARFIRLAGGIRRVQCWAGTGAGSRQIHCRSEGASSKDFIPGGVHFIPSEIRD